MPKTLALWLAALVPLACYTWTASGHSYWLDSGEFVAASVRLDIAHPPGHPLSSLYGKLFTLLPLGPIPFRVALGQAVATALAALFVCRTLAALVRPLRLSELARWVAALASAWVFAFSYGAWFQAVRPEVYALQTLCMSVAIERLVVLAATGDARALGGAAVAFGLGLSNHHLIALLVLPAALPPVLRLLTIRRVRPVLASVALGACALVTYAYLPLRAATQPPANLGDPQTFERFAWVVSARIYARSMGTEDPQPLAERALDVVVILIESLGAPVVLAALCGMYLLVRRRETRRAALVVLAVLLVDGGARAWLGAVRANPDMLGYLAPALLATALFAGGLASGVMSAIGGLRATAQTWSPLLLALALLRAPSGCERASLARFHGTDAFDELRGRSLPPRAVVVASSFQTVFRHLELDAVEQARPDATLLPLPFLSYPGVGARVIEREPSVAPVVRWFSAHAQTEPRALRALARQRPTYLELDPHTPPSAYFALRPRGLLHEVLVEPRQRPTLHELERDRADTTLRLDRLLAGQPPEIETARQLTWFRYMRAVFFAAVGVRAMARSELRDALRLSPRDERLRALGDALRDAKAVGPLPVAPFLRF